MGNCMTFMRSIGKGEIKGPYVFYGEETYLMEQTILQIRKKLVPPETAILDYQEVPGAGLSVDELIRLVTTPPFMAERRVLVIRDDPRLGTKKAEAEENGEEGTAAPKKGSTKASKTETESFKKALNPGICLIFLMKEDFRAQNVWSKLMAEVGEIVEFPKQAPEDAAPWIVRMAKEQHAAIDRSDAAFLHEYGKGLLQEDECEIRKLAAYAGEGGLVTRDAIRELAVPSLEYKVFGMTDALMAGNAAEALVTLEHLLREGEPPAAMIPLLGMRIRSSIAAMEAGRAGVRLQDAAKAMGLNPYAVEKAARARSRLSLEDLRHLAEAASRADADFKEGKAGDAESLRLLVREIALTASEKK